MTDAAAEMSSATPPSVSFEKSLGYALWALVGIHCILLLFWKSQPVAASRYCTAAVVFVAALCVYWRAQRLAAGEKSTLRWAGAGIILWGVAHTVETVLGPSLEASNLAVDPSDFIYLAATFPLLLSLSTTRETASMRTVSLLNWAQIALAVVLTYFRLYRMELPPAAAALVMGKIYGVTCVLLAVMAALRLLTWDTVEERRSIGLIFAFLCLYLPVELGMDFATAHWKLQAGHLFDLLWSVPFLVVGWQSLRLPMERAQAEPAQNPRRFRLLVGTLCPMLIATGVFALAASIASQHATLALTAIFLLLVIQGLHAGLLQLNYLTGRLLLLEREQELREANATLQQLSLLDPLTKVANRRRFDAALDRAWRRALRKKHRIALLIIDVDFFKSINDRHGHAYGDECLVTVARLVEQQAGRPDDLLARYGGDEFFLLLPDTDTEGAAVVAKRIHTTIKARAQASLASPFEGRLTVSIGAAVIDATASQNDPAVLVAAADKALYEAKRLGRNQTHLQVVAEQAQSSRGSESTGQSSREHSQNSF
jgi:diguanylate cyclase (GGDEF)-like protein